MNNRIQVGGLQIAKPLYDLVKDEILPGTNISAEDLWSGFEKIVTELGPENSRLLQKRDDIQVQIDKWHQANPIFDQTAYIAMLKDIGYLVKEGEDFAITTDNVDAEIASIAGPQLVVPVNNARFALNAANARWVSLYDAMYGTDVIEKNSAQASGIDAERAAKVTHEAALFLDQAIPLAQGSHTDVSEYIIVYNDGNKAFAITLGNGSTTQLKDETQFIGFSRSGNQFSILLKNNNLHIELQIDRDHPIGKNNVSGVKDVVVESAISTIQDCEDSVAAVDAEDKVLVYRNWLGLMKGALEETFRKNGKQLTRRLNPDRTFTAFDGKAITLHGRSLLLVRNVGHLMTNSAVLDAKGNEVYEGMLDALITSACALHDIHRDTQSSVYSNSRTASVYIVKPKMHGPEEVALTNTLFNCVEDVLNLPRFTLKVGVMDEERRTTVNLKECIREVKDRIVFINTGFLDRTGDEIHTSMEAGPVLPKEQIKAQAWITAYENWNVDMGLACGLQGKAQIGKGMWPKPDEMKQMMAAKISHPKAGANCAWVPSPTAASLHAMHYHSVFVKDVQDALKKRDRASLIDILSPPLLSLQDGASSDSSNASDHKYGLSHDQITAELENNAQGILGYVVRWIDQGIGCSKVPDINNVGLMEDRATLRISSQHMANWLHHGICSKEDIDTAMKRMAKIVDQQNSGDTAYVPMAPAFDGIAFQTACALVFEGRAQASGYTEPLLHKARNQVKMARSNT